MSRFPLNIGYIIVDEMRARETKSVPEVFGPSGKATRVAGDNIDTTSAATGTEQDCIAPPPSTSILSISGAAMETQGVESTETLSAAPQTLYYAFTPSNFVKLVKREDRHEKQMKLFAEQLETFMNRDSAAALAPHKSLHARIDDMEAQVNERLKDLIESEEKEPFINLLAEQPKTAGKLPRESDEENATSQSRKHRKRKQVQVNFLEAQRPFRVEEGMGLEELQACVGGASSSLASKAVD
ncbi:hypothetical protein HAX54_009632 [Datura stramonium]|uniref:Uncharacterized protein n=1 Tax=Datura stramonium TaxID=4076 RepID=A0ABS8THP1_DATST|nr:hypothetical protein [Datura stramonium]